MHDGNVWELPFDQPAVLEMQAEFGNVSLVPVEPGTSPRLEFAREASEASEVHVEKVGEVVRVSLAPRSFNNWFGGGWHSGAVLYVPRDVRAAVQTSAGSVHVRSLEGCELGIKASAGKIDLVDVYGLMHLAAEAGSISGRGLGGVFDVETQAGSVRLEILDLQPGEHRFRAAMGSVRLDLARGMDVCIETHSSMGSVRSTYPVRADAPQRLLISTEMGSVRIDESPSVSAPRRPAAPTPKPPREDPELERILRMVEAGDLSASDADELLRAMGRV